MVELAEEGLAALKGTHTKAHARLEELHELYTFLGEGMKTALAQWQVMKRAKASNK